MPKLSHLIASNDMLSNNSAVNGSIQGQPKGLRILIVGAGIGGLTAAIGLRRQGHECLVSLAKWDGTRII